MKTLLRQLLDLCLLRIGPQDLPYSPALTRGLVVTSAALSLLFLQAFGRGERNVSHLVLSMVLLLVLPWLLLRLRQREARYAQTLAAFAGSSALFMVFLLPIEISLYGMPLPDRETPMTPQQLTITLLSFMLLGWRLSIEGNIWRHALDLPKFAGLPLALACFTFELALSQLLMPVAESATP